MLQENKLKYTSKISTGRAISTVKPIYRTSYALVRYIAARPFAKTVSSSIDTQNNESFMKNIWERIKEFFILNLEKLLILKIKSIADESESSCIMKLSQK